VDRLVLVRHGLTAWNAEGRYATHTDVPLAPAGEEQARTLGSALAAVPFSAAFASPLSRARRTAELILEAQADPPPLGLDDRLVEVKAGILEGSRPRDRESAEMRPHVRAWAAGGEEVPGAESDRLAAARARGFLQTAASLPGISLVVSHEHFLGIVVTLAVGVPFVAWRRMRLSNATVTVLDLAAGFTRPTLVHLGVPAPFERPCTPGEAEAFRRQLGLAEG
jgi:probable phosphoglycerate mutase